MKKKVKFLTYQQQLDLLRDHGLIITNDRIGIELLKSRGYYNLVNRYKQDLYRKGKHEYPIQTTLEDLYKYHRMEDDLRDILFRFTLNIEQRLKENMSYALASNFGVDPKNCLNPHNFNSRHARKTENILYQFETIIEKPRSQPLKYYKENYDVIPPWILLNDAMFGETRMLFSIFPRKLKMYVIKSMLPILSQDYGSRPTAHLQDQWDEYVFDNIRAELEKKVDLEHDTDSVIDKATAQLENEFNNKLIELFSTMIRSINDFRNSLAHGDRLIHFKSRYNLKYNQAQLVIDDYFTKNQFNNKKLGNGIYGILLILLLLLDKYDDTLLTQQLKDWKSRNIRTYNDKKTFSLFTKNCNLPFNFPREIDEIRKEVFDYFVLGSKGIFGSSKYDDYN
ncbi:Abi family protein [Lactobacillus crispatus]|uniref:Abi family protein n=1 Tax=Lactobacillus crispatus TaxID=47770 RepID=UPI0022AC79E7|nr:Abi family protein [Lactobacillus crispatus]MCZ3847151.1 Abi family protein [Lactobacillus crispatus]MCZ3849413.1 Abi family protein [Lactobacillus crispatus]MCZ3855349.1 Abi family protein [Lactobacillus crispatus]MCZ3857532.1 Abi family protein [Lactobacillus crispatus]MCZ3859906.1 Abi family protein [Lactobacillus crispatus]